MGQIPLQAALQAKTGTTLDAQGAANAWAATTGLALIGALNAKNGTRGMGLRAVIEALNTSQALNAQSDWPHAR